MKASDLFVKCLEAEGVEYIFGIPGEENLDLLNSLGTSDIKLIVTRHEQAAGFMAATYGRLTGKVGVCMATLGPGATNLVTAAAYAQLGAMPMLMITGQKPIKTSKQGQFQILDVVGMMRPLTKFTKQIKSGSSIPSLVREAFRRAREERPGAAHLELPEDVAREETDAPVVIRSKVRRPVAERRSIRDAVELIKSAQHPLLLLGAAANRKITSSTLKGFLAKTNIPFFTTQMGKGVVDERSPLFLGNAALSDHDFLHRAIARADLIINVGHDVVEKPPFFMSPDRMVIHVNFISAQVDPVYFPQLEVIGDIADSVERITRGLDDTCSWNLDYFSEIKEAIEEHIGRNVDDDSFPMLPQRLVSDIRKVMPSNGIIALDNGMYKIWFARNYKAHMTNTVLLDNALATMGAGLPSAMAAKLVHPDRPVMAICGDGGFMMNSQEMETAVRLGLHLIVLIIRDNGYGMIKWKQAQMGFEDFGLDIGNPDFVKYAESYGAHGHRVKSAGELVPTLKKCITESGVHVMEVQVDYSGNTRILSREIKDLSSRIT
ncbi:MAG TPA: acetolactate synthase large subunit [Proteobacteria bacterium]|nr:acetolactate synthase, catabolic [bacterium BMS3Abin14]HDL53615.1 acetolactate synthase large subunit [Pseudomonadota bacterium]